MKNSLLLLLMLAGLSACQDVVDVEVPSEEPRLVVDALIRVDTLQETTRVIVKVSETNSFFGSIPPASLDQISLDNLDFPLGGGTATTVLIEEIPDSGIYTKVFPTEYLTRGRLLLQIDYDEQLFVANSEFQPSVPIDNLVQGEGGLFGGDETEVEITFTDIPDQENYYLFDFDFANFIASEDTFYEGQQFKFSYFYDEELDPGTELEISIMGTDKPFYDYMNLLLEQSGEDFGVFETPSLTVRGNIINATDIDNNENSNNVNMADNFALGYFAVVQEYKETFTVE